LFDADHRAAIKTSNYAALLRELCPELEWSRPGQLHAERLPDLRTIVAFGSQKLGGAHHWEDLPGLAATVTRDVLAARQREQEFDDPIDIQYTSGTTGLPKGATLSHHMMLNNTLVFGKYLRLSDQDRFCVTVPFYHCGGMLYSTLMCVTRGATLVIPAPVFDAGTILRTIEAERCTGLRGVPTMFIAELNHPDFGRFDLSSLRTGLMSGSACPIEIIKQVIDRMKLSDLVIGYGMTELSPGCTMTPPRRSLREALFDRRPGLSPRRVQDCRPVDRPGGPARHAGRARTRCAGWWWERRSQAALTGVRARPPAALPGGQRHRRRHRPGEW
jgi:fatty-acyl-CoA synthase